MPTHGTSQSYLLRRLQRDRPELVEQWEAKHRTDGRPNKETGSVTSSSEDRDHTEARGIRRRLQKRANAGDEQAKELVLVR